MAQIILKKIGRRIHEWKLVLKNRARAKAYGKIRVSPRIERARVICQRPRKNFGKERAFDTRARHG